MLWRSSSMALRWALDLSPSSRPIVAPGHRPFRGSQASFEIDKGPIFRREKARQRLVSAALRARVRTSLRGMGLACCSEGGRDSTVIRAVEPVLSDGKLEELEHLGAKVRHEREHGSWTSISLSHALACFINIYIYVQQHPSYLKYLTLPLFVS